MAVQTFLDASTGHITTYDRTLLCGREHKFPTRVIPHDHGWWINIPGEKELSEAIIQMYMQGFSRSFMRLLVAASDRDCCWVNLHTDGDIWEDLEIHEDPKPHDSDDERAFAAIEENKVRALRAERALKSYDLETGYHEVINIEHVIDLITDIQHYCRFKSWPYTSPLQSARTHFHAEMNEEIFSEEQAICRYNNGRYDQDEIIIIPDQKMPGVTPGQFKIHKGIPDYSNEGFYQNSKLFEHENLDVYIAIKPHISTEINEADEVSDYLVDLLMPLVIHGAVIEIHVEEREVE